MTYADPNFNASILSVGNITVNATGSASAGSVAVSGSGTNRTVTLSSLTGNGTLGISIAAGTASDTGGNAAPAAGPSATFTVTPANTAPTFVGTMTNLIVGENSSAVDLKSLLPVSDADSGQTLTWSENAAPAHGTLSFSSATAVSGSTNITPGGTITYTPATNYLGSDSFTVQVNDGPATATRTINVTVRDTTAPTVDSIVRATPADQVIRTNTTVFTVTFSEPLTNVTADYFQVTTVSGTVTGAVASLSGAGSIYQVTVTNNATAGEFRLDVVTPAPTISSFGSGYNAPLGLAFDAVGNLYVANTGNNTVSQIAPDGSVITNNFGSGYSSPWGLAFDAAGHLYVANYGNNTVSQIAPDGSVITNNFGSGYRTPKALAFDVVGNLYVANGTKVTKIAPDGSVITSSFGSGYNGPQGLAFDPVGNLYVANYGNNTVSQIAPDSSVITNRFGSGYNSPWGLACDVAGHLYVANYGNNTVSQIAPDGSVITNNFSSGYNHPIALAFDAAGNLYVANNGGNTISKVTLATIQDLAGNAVTGLPYTGGESYTYQVNTTPVLSVSSNILVYTLGDAPIALDPAASFTGG